MKRSPGVTISAVLVGLGSGLVGLSGLMAVPAAFVGGAPASPEVPAAMLRAFLFLGIFILLGAAAWGIVTAVGLFGLKKWARWSMLIFCSLWVLFTLPSALMMTVVPIPTTPGVPPESFSYIRVFLAVFYLTMAAMGGFWLYYFNRKTVRVQFGAGAATDTGPGGRPLSISIIAWLMIISGVTILGMAMLSFPAMLFGMVIGGWPGRVLYIVYGGFSLWAGAGLLRLNPVGRIMAIVLYAHGVVNSLLFYALPNMEERLAEMYAGLPGFSISQSTLTAMGPSMLMGVVFSAIPIWFLVARGAAFDPQRASPSPPEPPLPAAD